MPTRLLLKGISSVRNKPLALINDRSLAMGESGKLRIGTTNISVRCPSISDHSVRIRMLDTGVETDLQLSDAAAR